jgi:predicted dehydrogenase
MSGCRLKAGVIGVGHLGRIHARIYNELADVELVGVADSDQAVAATVAGELGVAAYGSAGDLLDAGPDLVSLATPTVSHADLGEQVLRRGCHLLVEKPLAASLGEADRLIDAAAAAGRVLQVGHLERFNPAYRSLQRKLSQPLFIEAHRLGIFSARSIDVDVVLDLMIHDLDLVLSMDSSGLRQVDASGVAILTPKVDIASARLSFQSGCVANITASRVSADQVRKFRIFQRDAYFSLDLQEQTVQHVYLSLGGGLPQIVREGLQVEGTQPLQAEISGFLDVVRDGGAPLVSGPDGRNAMELALLVRDKIESHLKSAETGAAPAS